MPRPISERRRISDERRNNERPVPYRRGGRNRRQASRFVIDESVNDDDDTESGEELAPGESQILDETGDIENDFNDTTTLGGFIADDSTLNETANQTNWTLAHESDDNTDAEENESDITDAGTADDDGTDATDATDASSDNEIQILPSNRRAIILSESDSEEGPEVIPPDTQIRNAQPLNQSDVHIYEEEFSPVEEVDDTPRRPEVKPEVKQEVKVKIEALEDSMSDSHSTCVICCEVLTSDGKHEIVVLANCGHIFGRSCIDEWIATGKKECPNCKKKATKKDVRKIYPQSLPLTVADNSENEQLRKVNEEQSKKISNYQREIRIMEEKLKEKDAELIKRKTELSHLRNNRFNTTGAGSSSTQMFQSSQNSNSQSQLDHTIMDQENIHFDWIKEEPIIDRSEKFSSKVLAIDDKATTAAVSACTPTSMSAIYGALKFGVYCIDPRLMKKGRFIGIHKDEIRDMKFGSGFLLTGSNDKTLRVVDLERAKTISVHHGTHPIWSVAWNSAKYRVYGGLRNGEIAEFDFRTKEKEPVRILKSSFRTPIHSMQFKNNGIIGAQYNGLSWIPLDGSPPMETEIPWGGTGPCQSFHMLKNSVLTTYRRNIMSPTTCISTISFNSSSQGNRMAKADVVSQFVVGNQHHKICRDKLINVNGGLVAACSNQQGYNTRLFTARGDIIQELRRNPSEVVDIQSFQCGENTILCELNGKTINFYKLRC